MSRDTSYKGKIRAKMSGCSKSWCTFETLAVGMTFMKIFSLSESVSQYLQEKQLDFVQATRLTSTLIQSVAAINIDEALDEAKSLALKCNEVLERLDSSDTFVNRYGSVNVRVSTEPDLRRVPVVPRRPGEIARELSLY